MALIKKVIIIAFILIFCLLFIRFVFGGPEDSWICVNGVWTKHGHPSYPKPENPCGKKITLPKNEIDCLKIKGVWKKLGPDPFKTCNIKANDRGNICHDGSECQGMCQVDLTKEELSQGMRGKLFTDKKRGACSVWVVELGCRGIMKDGKAQVICMD